MLPDHIPNSFTIDVEDYFQVSAFEHRVSRKHWDSYESRVEANTDKLLVLLDQHSVRATFFILGWVADRHPALIKRIQAEGHELASHGYWHNLVYRQTPEEFARDLANSQEAIANASGLKVTAYRAPSFSIVERSLWALGVLVEQGFSVDSSIFPIAGHDRYGVPGAKKEIHEISTSAGPIIEFPPSAWHVGRINFPVGGGYFRILPLGLTQKSIAKIRSTGRPAMFYIHPWEIDPEQPRLARTGWKSAIRHYTGLGKSYQRLVQLLRTNRFSSMSDCLAIMNRQRPSDDVTTCAQHAPARAYSRT